MEYNKYMIFLEVAKCGNLTKAADTLGYTQSGISHTLRRLEEEYNLSLFYRSRNGAQLTPAGEAILPYVTQLVQSEKSLKQMVQSLHDLHQGTLNIGSYISISRNWLPSIIQRFKQDFPSIKINFKEGGNEDILLWLENHEIDLGFLSTDQQEGMEWIPLATDHLRAVLPRDYPVPASGLFPLEDFHGKTFIISAPGIDIDIHRTLQTYQITPDIQYSAKDDYTIISMVEHHLGISILPELILQDHSGNVLTLPLEPDCTRQLGILVPSVSLSSPVTSTFIEYTRLYIDSIK